MAVPFAAVIVDIRLIPDAARRCGEMFIPIKVNSHGRHLSRRIFGRRLSSAPSKLEQFCLSDVIFRQLVELFDPPVRAVFSILGGRSGLHGVQRDRITPAIRMGRRAID